MVSAARSVSSSRGRRVATLAFAALAAAACGRDGSRAAPLPADDGQAPAAIAPTRPPSLVVQSVVPDGDDGPSRSYVSARPEDASAPARTISPAGAPYRAAAVLEDGRVVLARLDTTGEVVTAVVVVDAFTGKAGEPLATFERGRGYGRVSAVRPVGDRLVVALGGGAATDGDEVWSMGEGAPARRLARTATIVAAGATRAALLVGRDASSGRGDLTLADPATLELTRPGGGDADDAVAKVEGARVLVTLHASRRGDVRVVDLDAGASYDLATSDADERGVGFDRGAAVWVGGEEGRRSLFVAPAAAGAEARRVAGPDAAIDSAFALGDGTVVASTARGLFAFELESKRATLLDAAMEGPIDVFGRVADRVVYVGRSGFSRSLRGARLDGTGVAVLFEKALTVVLPLCAIGDRLVFRSSLIIEPDGGFIDTVRVDGSGRRPAALGVAERSSPNAVHPAHDRDFLAVTPSGRLVLEVEYEGGLATGSQIVTTGDALATAHPLSERGRVRFAGLVAPR